MKVFRKTTTFSVNGEAADESPTNGEVQNGKPRRTRNGSSVKPAAPKTRTAPSKAEKVQIDTPDQNVPQDEGVHEYVSALMREVQERDEKLARLEEEFASQLLMLDDKYAAREQELVGDVRGRDEKIEKLETVLVEKIRVRDVKIVDLESELAEKIAARDGKIAQLEKDFAEQVASRDAKIARLEEEFERARVEGHLGLSSRMGVDVSTILHAAESTAERLLTEAQGTAERLGAEARATAEELVGEAKAVSEELVGEAKANAARIRSQAEVEAAAFHAKLEQIVGEVRVAHSSLGELARSLGKLDGERSKAQATRVAEPAQSQSA